MSPSELTQQLEWRYATKVFDPSRKLDAATWQALEEALKLSPSSFGLQPWHFHVITNQELKDSFVPHAWGQKQLSDCSHLVVFTTKKVVDAAHVSAHLENTAAIREIEVSSLQAYSDVVHQFIGRMSPEQMQAWTTRQVYIALGQLMTSAALLGVDTCPLEGIDPAAFDQILGLEGSEYATCVACAVGYRSNDDKYATTRKVRFPKERTFTHHA